ncbi:hypothetical protein [Ornithinibacillus contaminans]|uniref:hypothetical protein n=1 Tax=Ornithinibacillus contaminans TaxID=694055 RepID=UPI00064D8CE5|nr:hypothetical protein [Ornithinibacillus contaminans]
MAFGLNRHELKAWKEKVERGEIAFLTHYWLDDRFPGCTTVTKVGCNDLQTLMTWGAQYDLSPNWIHRDMKYPHYDLFGEKQKAILVEEGIWEQINKFDL